MEKMTSLSLMDSRDPTHPLMEKSTNLRKRYFWNLPLGDAEVELTVETWDLPDNEERREDERWPGESSVISSFLSVSSLIILTD